MKGIAFKVASTLAFAAMNALIKAASARFGVSEIVLFRSFFALLVVVIWLYQSGDFPAALETHRLLGHVGRSLAGGFSMFAGFVALGLLPLADAVAFTFVAPLLIVPLAALTLGEDVRPYRWAGVGIGFAGVVVMLSDQLGLQFSGASAQFGVGVALAGAAATSVAMIQTRRLTFSEATGAIVFYFQSVTTALSALVLLAAALWPAAAPGGALVATQAFLAPNFSDFVLLAMIGVCGGIAQILMTQSYRFADASVVAAFDYVAMIWAAAIGYMVFDEAPTPRVMLGAAIVAGSGLYVLGHERMPRRPAVAAK